MKLILRKRPEMAATIVEIVFAVAIVVITAGGLMSALGYGFFAMQLTRENQRATQILLEKIETIRLYNWSQVNSNGYIPANFTNVYDPQGGPNQQGTTYYGTVTITNFPGSRSYDSKLRQLIVTLDWTTGGRIPHTRTLATAIAEDGEQNYVW